MVGENYGRCGVFLSLFSSAKKPDVRTIYIGIPVLDGKPHVALADCLLAEQMIGQKYGVRFKFEWVVGCSIIGLARNELVRRFLRANGSSSIVFVDADISWQPGVLTRLAIRSEPVIGGTYRPKQECERYFIRGPVEAVGGLYRVGGLPGGFLKVDRSAFLAIKAEAYECEGLTLNDYFPIGINKGVYWGEDYGFCRLWREAGGTVWLDPSIQLRHHDGGRFYSGNPNTWLRKNAYKLQT
jgi:hypothetical protein